MDILWMALAALASIILVALCIFTIAGTVTLLAIIITYFKEKLHEH